MPMTSRTAAMVAALFCATAAVRAAPPVTVPAASSDPATRDTPVAPPADATDSGAMGTSDLYARTGGSLMRASRGIEQPAMDANGASQLDPQVANMTLYAVSPPPPRVIRPHDLVTVIIKEQSEFKSEGTSSLDKKASLEAAINQFIKLNLGNAALENGIGSVAPKFDLTGESKFDGKGSAERKDSLSVRLQAMVIDVKPNGNLVLAARRHIRTDEEDQVFLVSGTARVADVTTDNTILSTQLYDFDLRQDTKGTVREATKRGWLPRLLDAVNPF